MGRHTFNERTPCHRLAWVESQAVCWLASLEVGWFHSLKGGGLIHHPSSERCSSNWQTKYGLRWGILIPQASKPHHWMISSTSFKGGLSDKGPLKRVVYLTGCAREVYLPNHVLRPNSGLTLRPWCWNRGWQAWQQMDGSNFWVIKCLPNSSWAEIHCWYAINDKAWEGQVVPGWHQSGLMIAIFDARWKWGEGRVKRCCDMPLKRDMRVPP